MIRLGILLTKNHRLLSVAAMLDVFEAVNRFYESNGESKFFDISLLHPVSSKAIAYSDHAIYAIDIAPQQDIILIPSFSAGDIADAVKANYECLHWIKQQHMNGAEIASFCTGAFLLAATGLLDNKPATTHVQAAKALAKAFPNVMVQPSEVSTFEEGIYTSGGATNSFHLMLRVIEKYCGDEMAVKAAKYFAIDMNREQQAYFSTFQPLQNHKDELAGALQKKIETEYGETGTIEEMMTEIPSSRRNLVRRFKAATGFTPIEYLQKTRIEAAKRILEQTDKSVLDIMLRAGYNDLKAFRHQFRKNTGMTPTEYREKFYRKKFVQLTARS